MRKLHKILYMMLFGVALTSLTACGDDDDYSSAPKVSADNMGAYFAASNAADEILTPEDKECTDSISFFCSNHFVFQFACHWKYVNSSIILIRLCI